MKGVNNSLFILAWDIKGPRKLSNSIWVQDEFHILVQDGPGGWVPTQIIVDQSKMMICGCEHLISGTHWMLEFLITRGDLFANTFGR